MTTTVVCGRDVLWVGVMVTSVVVVRPPPPLPLDEGDGLGDWLWAGEVDWGSV